MLPYSLLYANYNTSLDLQYPSLSSQALEDSNTNLLCPCPLGGLAGIGGSYFVLH